MNKVLIAVLTALATAAVFWLLAQFQVIPLFLFPKNGVVAFNRAECPPNWDPFPKAAGKVVMGVGQNKADQPIALGAEGGHRTVKILENNLPRHQHQTAVAAQESDVLWGLQYAERSVAPKSYGTHNTANTNFAGGVEEPNEIELTPPYVGLLYCVKR